MKPYQAAGYRGWTHPALRIPQSLFTSPSPEIGLAEAELLSKTRARTIWKAPLELAGSREDCFVWVFRNRSVSRALRRTYALHALRLSERLNSQGFGTFEVLAALKPRGELLNWNSLLIARKIRRVSELPSTGSHEFPFHPIAPLTDDLAEKLASSIARFHDRGFVHGDLKSRHILVPRPEGSNGHALYFVDLEKTKDLRLAPSMVRDILAARDLIQLFASLPEHHGGRSLETLKAGLLKRYLGFRSVSDARRRRIEGYVSSYRDGRYQQGETLLRSLLRRVGLVGSSNGTAPRPAPDRAQTGPSEIR